MLSDHLNMLKVRKNSGHFMYDIFKCIFINENHYSLIDISMIFFPKGPINNMPALVQIMTWHQTGDKLLSESMINLPHVTFNSYALGKFESNFRYAIFKQILVTGGWGFSYEISLIWMSLDFTVNQSTLVQVMAWCRQATSHYLSQCWPRSVTIWRH